MQPKTNHNKFNKHIWKLQTNASKQTIKITKSTNNKQKTKPNQQEATQSTAQQTKKKQTPANKANKHQNKPPNITNNHIKPTKQLNHNKQQSD